MRRLCFNYLVSEISAVVGQSIRRYPLWMRLHELGWNPETLGRAAAMAFCDLHLIPFLAEQGHRVSAREARRVRQALQRFQPASHR